MVVGCSSSYLACFLVLQSARPQAGTDNLSGLMVCASTLLAATMKLQILVYIIQDLDYQR
jgi:hypothetical protein